MTDTVRMQLDALAAWTSSADARAASEHELRRRGLPLHLADDVRQQTFEQVAARIARRGPIETREPNAVPAYARRALQHLVTGMLRGRSDALDRELASTDDVAVEPADRPEPVFDNHRVDAVRHHLFATLAPSKVWLTSAALTVVTLAVDLERTDAIGPQPDAGATGQWRYWTALWLAGQRQCFAVDGEVDDPARRQRRARAIKETVARLADSYETATASE